MQPAITIDEIVEQHYQETLARVYHHIPRNDVEDVTHEIFIAIMQSLDSFKGKSALSTWMRRIELNKIADYYRKAGRYQRIEKALSFQIRRPYCRSITDEVISTVLMADILEALEHDAQKEMLRLKLIEGLSFTEAANYVGCSYECARSRYRRGIESVRKMLNTRQKGKR